MADLEGDIANVWSADIRPLAEEAWRCYNVGAIRAAIAATWTAVTADLIEKIIWLADGGDADANVFRSEVAAAQTQGIKAEGVRAMQKIEDKLLDEAEKFELIDSIGHRELDRIREDRNLCVHPSLRHLGEVYEPRPEVARGHLATALSTLLTHLPTQGRKVLAEFRAYVSDPSFICSPAHIQATFFDRVRTATRRNIVNVAAKHALCELPLPEDVPVPAHVLADRMAEAVRAFALRDRELVRTTLAGLKSRFQPLDSEVQLRALSRLGDQDFFWDVVDQPLAERLNLRTWIEKELRLRYRLDRTDASEVAEFIFPIVDATGAGAGVLAAGLADELESWRPGFILLATQPVTTEAPSGILTVGDLAPLDAYAAVAERTSADPAKVIAAAEAAGTGPPRSPLEVSVMARWYAAAAPAGSAGHSSLMSLWVDTVIHAAALPSRSRTYLAFVAHWLQVNKQSAFRTTDALPSTRRVTRWTPVVILAVAAFVALIVGVLSRNPGTTLSLAIVSAAILVHSLHPHSHGRKGEFDTRLGWRSVVRSAGQVGAGNFVLGLLLGVLAGVGWGLLTIFRMLGPWLDFSLASLASNIWLPFVFPILAGSAIGLVMFIESVLAFAVWNALERLRWAAKGASPLRLRAFLRAAESAGFVHEDAGNFRFANSLIERHFAKAYLPLPMEPEVTHPGFWTLPDRT